MHSNYWIVTRYIKKIQIKIVGFKNGPRMELKTFEFEALRESNQIQIDISG